MQRIDGQEIMLYAFIFVLLFVSFALLMCAIIYNNSASYFIGMGLLCFGALILPKTRNRF